MLNITKKYESKHHILNISTTQDFFIYFLKIFFFNAMFTKNMNSCIVRFMSWSSASLAGCGGLRFVASGLSTVHLFCHRLDVDKSCYVCESIVQTYLKKVCQPQKTRCPELHFSLLNIKDACFQVLFSHPGPFFWPIIHWVLGSEACNKGSSGLQ